MLPCINGLHRPFTPQPIYVVTLLDHVLSYFRIAICVALWFICAIHLKMKWKLKPS